MRKTRATIYLIPMVIVFITIVTTYYKHYENTVKIIKSAYYSNVELIEQSIYNETKYTEMIGDVFEGDIRDNMQYNTNILLEEYKENPNVLDWDLEEMKRQVDDMDIYILDKDLKIIASTIHEEIGLDFNQFSDFSKILEERLAGNQFESDPLNFSLLEGKLIKYSFMPTPDHEYIIELSVNAQELFPQLKDLNIVYLTNKLKEDYPFIEDMKIYKFNQNKQYSHELERAGNEPNTDIDVTKEQDEYVKKALKTGETQQISYQGEDDNTYTLKYIPYTAQYDNESMSWWKSHVIEVTYNEQITINKIWDQRKMFLQSMVIISSLYIGLGCIIIFLITKNQRIANEDYLTKLPNRKRLEEVMASKISMANRNNTKIAVLFFDLDGFKIINDTYGHAVGDKVLQIVANTIKSEMPKDDIISRLGGDEFVGVISGIRKQEEIDEIGEQMAAQFKDLFKIGFNRISVKPSMGISIYPDHGNTIEDLILKADHAMYEAKKSKVRYVVYKD